VRVFRLSHGEAFGQRWDHGVSPQAIENAKHGVWLWPPAERGRPG
jgi:hypothetical protein